MARVGVDIIMSAAVESRALVMADLDEGSIVSQVVLKVNNEATPNDLIVAGRDVEGRVLADAVRMSTEQRVLLNDGKTVVFT